MPSAERILITGRGTSGSWQIRGVQLGRAIGATVQVDAHDVAAYDAVVVVKRIPDALLARIHAAGVPLVWDVVDAWPQPEGNHWSADLALAWMRQQLARIKPAAVVAATAHMALDLQLMTAAPVLHLPHHARPLQPRNPIREQVQVVGYQGGEQYIREWRKTITEQCRARGWRFVVNPPELGEVDIALALRDATGYPARAWKSNVKQANAQATGTPLICNREAGYVELAIGGAEKWADTPKELAKAFDALTPHAERVRVARWLRAAAPSLDTIAMRYRAWLLKLCETSNQAATC
jgi:hypothetical protein